MIFKNSILVNKNNKNFSTIYNFSVNDLNNNLINLDKKRNKIILIVNSASS
jgi:glutathione peroxidase-family protein